MMNAVEIEEAVSQLAEQPFDREEFPFAFLEAFGNKATTLKRLRTRTYNRSDIGGVLQPNNIHIKVCEQNNVPSTLQELKESVATTKAKAKFVLATDGQWLEAEDLNSGETIACDYSQFHERFGFFLPLAGITTVKEIRENAFDIRATGKLDKLYVELSKTNPEWASSDDKRDINLFLARLIFCFFAEDTDIFGGVNRFTETVAQMTTPDSSNTHEVIGEIFRAMKTQDRANSRLRSWADQFPYVNGGLFSGSVEVPIFSKMARSYLLNIGRLDWTKINPDIFGSMIQAVEDENERSTMGMHYTSVSNILKVLNPLFLDSLRTQLEEAGTSLVKLLNLRKRISSIRVFDPACGSGNFLVIAYKAMRSIEALVNQRRGESDRKTDIPLTNFRGIEVREFPAEIARLTMVIASYQCDVLYRGQKEALNELLPLDDLNWITCGNALRLNWKSICPPSGEIDKPIADDLLYAPKNQNVVKFEGGRTDTELYICGNPPYLGYSQQSSEHKSDLKNVLESLEFYDGRKLNFLDYISGWFLKAAEFCQHKNVTSAFVSTNSVCQGMSISTLWPLLFKYGQKIQFAYTSFKWMNLASNNAGVSVVIVALTSNLKTNPIIFSTDSKEVITSRVVDVINPYLSSGNVAQVRPLYSAIAHLPYMESGNTPRDGGNLIMDFSESNLLLKKHHRAKKYLIPLIGSKELVQGTVRMCLWIDDNEVFVARELIEIKKRLTAVRLMRQNSKRKTTKLLADQSHRFAERRIGKGGSTIVIPSISSELRPYLPVGLIEGFKIVSNRCFVIYDEELWSLALIASRVHLVWIGAVCGRLETRFSYSTTLGWNTFPVPKLTTKNKEDLTRAAENILLAREEHFPATIADLYKPDQMPENLRIAHYHNDEIIERIFIGRRFKNDTERLEKLFELYSKMTGQDKSSN